MRLVCAELVFIVSPLTKVSRDVLHRGRRLEDKMQLHS